MALTVEDNRNGAPQAPQSAPNPAAPQNAAPQMPGMQAQPLSFLMATYASAGALSQEASAYVDAIILELKKKDPKMNHKWINVRGLDAVVFLSADNIYGYGIIFAEPMSSDVKARVPIAWWNELQQFIGNGTNLLDALVVVKEDYKRAIPMANHVYRQLHGQTAGIMSAFNINSIRKQNQIFRVTDSLSEGLMHIDQLNPLASRPRTDMTVTLEVASTDQRPPNGELQWERILTVGGYTRFVDYSRYMANMAMAPGYGQFGAPAYPQMPQSKRILPLVTITSVASELPSVNMLAFALPMAARAWLNNNGFIRPYLRFTKDGINIGNLVIDTTTDQPVFVESKQMLDQFVAEVLQPPALAMDVTLGRSRIIGTTLLKNDKLSVNRHFNGFFAGNAMELERAAEFMIQNSFEEFIGLAGDGSDSRCVDYLTLLANKVDYHKCKDLLNISIDPTGTERGVQISQFDVQYRPLYYNQCHIFHNKYLEDLGNQFSKENTAVQIDWGNNAMEGAFLNLSTLQLAPSAVSFGLPTSRRAGYGQMGNFTTIG
jgi:hypothetical protein